MATSRMTTVMTELPSIFYEEPEPVEDGMQQAFIIHEVVHLIASHFRGHPNTLVSAGGFIFYDRNDGNRRVAPDLYIAFGVDVKGMRENEEPNYWIWRHGKPPDFVMEVASPSTADNDLGYKRLLYERLGIREYWRLDGSRGSRLYGQPLVGERLVDGVYRPYELHTADDGTLWSHSEALGLQIHWGPDLLEQYDVRDPETGRTIRPEVVEREGRLAERSARLAAEAERDAAEARERELLAEIERLRRQQPES